MSTPPHIVVVGSTMIDLVTYVDPVPERGETVVGERFVLGYGGKGANQAVMTARLGARVTFVNRVGDDLFGEMARQNLAEREIDVTRVRNVRGEATGVASIWVEHDGMNRIVMAPGANHAMSAADVSAELAGVPPARCVICQLEIPPDAVLGALRWGRARLRHRARRADRRGGHLRQLVRRPEHDEIRNPGVVSVGGAGRTLRVTPNRQRPGARSPAARAGRAWLVIATSVAVLAFSAAPAGAQCGETTDVGPRVSVGPGPPPLAVGDSVLYDASRALAADGFHVNAMVCRTMAQGIVWLEGHGHDLPTLVVVALGTNGAVTAGQIDQLLAIVGPNRVLALVTPHHGNYAYVPALFRSAARQFPGRIILLDWDQLSAGHFSWFAADGIHLGSTAGVDAFARLVASALLATPAQASTSTVTVPGPVTIGPAEAIPTGPATPAWGPRTAAVVRLAVSTFAAFRRWLFIL